jgi:hypothetical protein
MDGLGLSGKSTATRIRAACRALVEAGLFVQEGERYAVDSAEIGRLKALAGAMRR